MQSQITKMIATKAIFTARRPDTAKHQPKVLNIVKNEKKDGYRVVVKRSKEDHVVWRGGHQWRATKAGLMPLED